MFIDFQRDVRRIVHEVIELVYFMRGSIQYNDMMERSYVEREIIRDFINERMEQEKNKMVPIY